MQKAMERPKYPHLPSSAMSLTQLLLVGLLLVDPVMADPSKADGSLRGVHSSATADAPQRQQQRRRKLPDQIPVGGIIQGIMGTVDRTPVAYVGNCQDEDGRRCGMCQGDCDRDGDCQGQLRCFFREHSYVEVPGCIGAEGSVQQTDYCYMPPLDEPDVRDVGKCGDGKCGLCEGDCDFDEDCEGDLKCFQRHYYYTDVPGCYGGRFNAERIDFCYQPHPPAKDEVALVGCSSKEPCPKCRGECNSDDDCEGDLKCFPRDEKYIPVPGCRNGHYVEELYKFCYDPTDDNVVKRVGCSPDDRCYKCRGNCETDDDCKSGLKCFQRNLPYQLVPGCEMGTDQSNKNYCYDPDDVDEEEMSSKKEPDKGDWPDSYFNYDLNDAKWGPSNWQNTDISKNEWKKYEFLKKRVSDNRCNGDDQSPININTVTEKCEEEHHIYYPLGMTEEMNDRELVEYAITPFRLRINFEKVRGVDPPQLDLPGGVGGRFTTKDGNHVEYLEPSEHMIGGERFDGEFRMMFAQDNYKSILAVALMVKVTSEHNPYFEVILRKWERVNACGNGKGRTDIPMDYMELKNMVTSMYFWAYEGSLTVPPCSPFVQWRIPDTPVKISKEQKERTSKLLTDGGPCKDHPLRQSPQQNGGARPIQRDANSAKVWRCTTKNYMWEDGKFVKAP